MKFLTALKTEHIPGGSGRLEKLIDELIFFADEYGDIIVPVEFITDLGSFPFLPLRGRYDPATVIHDWLYKTGEYSRKVADKIFKMAMDCSDVAWFWRQVIYQGVRVGGWYAWNKHRKREKK